MKLLTEPLKKKIPAIYSQDGKGNNSTVYAKFFCPWNSWTWYVTEYDPERNECFGYVDGDYPEWGYFSVTELEGVKHKFIPHLGIERDISFEPTKARDIEGVKI